MAPSHQNQTFNSLELRNNIVCDAFRSAAALRRANFQQKIMRAERMMLFRNSINMGKNSKLYKFPNRNQTISTPRLNPLPDLHLEPIKVVICDLSMISNLGAGFSLRCFQRLSHPDIATRRCPWQDSRHTRGRSTLILSYREQSSSKI